MVGKSWSFFEGIGSFHPGCQIFVCGVVASAWYLKSSLSNSNLSLQSLTPLFHGLSESQWTGSSMNWIPPWDSLHTLCFFTASSCYFHSLYLNTPKLKKYIFSFSFKGHSKTATCLSHFHLNSLDLHYCWQFCGVHCILSWTEIIYECELMSPTGLSVLWRMKPFFASFICPGTGHGMKYMHKGHPEN